MLLVQLFPTDNPSTGFEFAYEQHANQQCFFPQK